MNSRKATPPTTIETWRPNFEQFYADVMEPRIRLPRKSPAASKRTVNVGYAALASTFLTLIGWLVSAPSELLGLLVIVSGALTVGALQLRMSGTSLGARDTRDFAVQSMAQFLQLEHRGELPLEQCNLLFAHAGAVSSPKNEMNR